MDRNLFIGMVFSLALHGVGACWAAGLVPRPRPLPDKPNQLVRVVRQEIALPKPPPPPPPPVVPPKPLEEQVKAPEAPTDKPPPPVAKRTPQVKSNQPPAKALPPSSNEPAPLVLSKTYGAEGDAGVAVATGAEDSLGDSSVAPTNENTRKRTPGDGAGKSPAEGTTGSEPAARRVEIVQARPKESCNRYIEWPEGAEAGGRVVEVTLQLEISEEGSVRKVRILRSAGDPFDTQAVRDIKRCPFAAGSRDGKPIVSKIAFVVEFKPRS